MSVAFRKRRLQLSLLMFVLFFGIFCVAPAWWIFALFWLPNIQMRQAIKTYPNAKFLFEDFQYMTTDSSKSTLYYWTLDSRDAVAAYFTKTLETTFFESGRVLPEAGNNNSDYWLITSYQLNGVKLTKATENMHLPRTHTSVCDMLASHSSDDFKCISISLIKADQPDVCRVPIISGMEPSNFLQTPYKKCVELPTTGTLIIYQFYLDEM